MRKRYLVDKKYQVRLITQIVVLVIIATSVSAVATFILANKEVSSASNAHDYQARRGNIRFKRTSTRKNELIHSLNASGLATSRLIPAIVEQFQEKDGSVVVPEVLRPRVGKDRLMPVMPGAR